MTLLADACALIAFHGYGGKTMSEAGKTAMASGDVVVSPITVWEIRRKVALGKLARPCPTGFNGSFSAWLRSAGHRPLPLSWDAAEKANDLPPHHKDPIDRMLIATALERAFAVITDDASFEAYGVETIW